MKKNIGCILVLFCSLSFVSGQQITSINASRFTVASVEQIAVNFETLNEHDWCYFDIKREVNYAGGFNTIHTMYAIGNTAQSQAYLYTDFGPFGPTDVYCYRIDVWDDIDLDAVCEYYISSITACDNSTGIGDQTESPFFIYPSPTNGKVSITKSNLISSIQVSNTLGEIVDVSAVVNSNQGECIIDISDRPNGIYFIIIRVGDKSYSHKIVKQ